MEFKKEVKVDIAVCGKFHYHKYVKYLEKESVLNRLYCSYKRGFYFYLKNEKLIKNYFFKQYLMYINIIYMKKLLYNPLIRVLFSLWEKRVSINKVQSNLLHCMIHGNSYSFIKKYKIKGAIVLGEAVNAHPNTQLKLLKKAYNDLGEQYTDENWCIKEKMMKEFQECDYILTASSFVKSSFVENGFDPKKIFVLPYGMESINKGKFIRKKSKNTTFKILCVAQISYRKGQVYLLEAVKQLINAGMLIELTLVGSYSLDPGYRKHISKYEKYFRHVEHIDNDKMVSYMKEYNLFVLPSIEDGFSVVISEALSAGVPVITTKNNGAVEMIEHLYNGLIINAYSVEDIKQGVLYAMNNQFHMAQKAFTWEEYSLSLLKIYHDILSPQHISIK